MKIIIVLLLVFLISCSSDSSTTEPENSSKNIPPQITSLVAQPDAIKGRETIKLTCLASDSDNDNLTYNWFCREGTFSGEGLSVNWSAPNRKSIFDIICTVTDGNGGNDSDTVTVIITEVAPNQPPTIISFKAEKNNLSVGETTTITVEASDIDGDDLSYMWLLNSPGELFDQINGFTSYKALEAGVHTIECLVSDDKNNTTKASLVINVN